MATASATSIEQLAINTIRTLAMDAVQAANSGHPGTPMALAPVAYALWNDVLRYDPDQPALAQPRSLRALLRPCLDAALLAAAPGRREAARRTTASRPTSWPCRWTRSSSSASCTAAARAIPKHGRHHAASKPPPARWARAAATASAWRSPQRWLAAHFNRPGFDLFDFNVFALCSDGDLMEGVANEAASLAGHLEALEPLLDLRRQPHHDRGQHALAFSEDVATRFDGYGWNVIRVADANDLEALRQPIEDFQRTDDRPTMIIVRSHIGYGSPHKQDTHKAHGEPLGEDEIRLTKEVYGWPEDAQVPRARRSAEHFRDGVGARGAKLHDEWQAKFDEVRQGSIPSWPHEWQMMERRELPDGLGRRHCRPFPADAKGMASRVSSGKVLNAVGQARSLADRRLGRPGPFDHDAADIRRRRRFRARQLRRPQLPLRHPRARHGRGRSTAWRCRTCGPTARRSSSSPTTAAVDPPGRDHGTCR